MKKLNKPYLTLVTRADWGARKPKNLPQLMVTPVRMMMLFDTQTPECNNVEECIKTVKGLQDEYMDKKGYEDIPWNFLVASDGKVYEGRGWKFKPFKTDLENVTQTEWDGSSVDIAYIGDYRNKIPNDHQNVTVNILQYLRQVGCVDPKKIQVASFILQGLA